MRVSIAVALCLPLVLTGCTLTSTDPPLPVQGAAIQGSVYGGQQPIVGSHVYLFAANTTGYGGSGIAPSSSNASVSLLSAISTGHSDSLGAYVLSGAGGNFSITGDYNCTPNQQVYVYALGGDPGAGGANPHAGLMAVLGNCPVAGNFAGTVSFITVNEVTTVAAAYAMAGFASDATHVSSSGTALAKIGIANAFANAANLADLGSGTALATTPGGNGTAPQNEINTLANALATCINSDGSLTGPSNASACYTLLTSALSGGSSGTQPTDTATAAINIAHNPGVNVAAIYGLPDAQAPFAPVLSAQPNDWTVGIQFAQGSATDPYAIAIDGSGNVWAANNGSAVGAVVELGPDGSQKSGSAGFNDGTSAQFNGIAIDLNGNVWVPSYQASCLVEFRSTDGLVLSPPGGFTGGGLSYPQAVAIDASNNVWVANNGSYDTNLQHYVNTGVSVYSVTNSNWVTNTGYTGGSLSAPWSIAMDHSGNAWVANKDNNNTVTEVSADGMTQNSFTSVGGISLPRSVALDSVDNVWIANGGSFGFGDIAELSNAGSALSPFSGYGAGVNTGGIDSPQAIAIDGAGNVWLGDQAVIVEFDNSGNPLSPNTGYIVPGTISPATSVAIDGSGNVWVAQSSALDLVELVGAATPVVTPISVGVKNNTLGTRP